jgi:DNA-binding FadR family transcriptional regulator
MASVGSAPSFPPRVSRAARIAGELEREIRADAYLPGERLGTKEDLRERFGVAVATVTEALRLLETRGLTEARPGPGGGIFVTRAAARVTTMHNVLGFQDADAATYRDCLLVRDALEPLICRDAAHNRRVHDVRALDDIVERMTHHESDPVGYFELNWELHRRLAALTANVPLRTIYSTLLDYLEATLDHAVYHQFDGGANIAVHRELVAAIAEGSGARLEAAIAAHAPLPPLD